MMVNWSNVSRRPSHQSCGWIVFFISMESSSLSEMARMQGHFLQAN